MDECSLVVDVVVVEVAGVMKQERHSSQSPVEEMFDVEMRKKLVAERGRVAAAAVVVVGVIAALVVRDRLGVAV